VHNDNKTLERIWKETIVQKSKKISRHLEGETEKNHEKANVSVADTPTRIRTRHFQNTSSERYRYGNLFSEKSFIKQNKLVIITEKYWPW
jgi:hypothetical protein